MLRTCRECGKEFKARLAGKPQVHCGSKCRIAFNNRINNGKRKVSYPVKTCGECRGKFKPAQITQAFCCQKCRNKKRCRESRLRNIVSRERSRKEFVRTNPDKVRMWEQRKRDKNPEKYKALDAARMRRHRARGYAITFLQFQTILQEKLHDLGSETVDAGR